MDKVGWNVNNLILCPHSILYGFKNNCCAASPHAKTWVLFSIVTKALSYEHMHTYTLSICASCGQNFLANNRSGICYSVLSSFAICTGRQVFQTGCQKHKTWKYHVRALFLAGEREWLSERTEWISFTCFH